MIDMYTLWKFEPPDKQPNEQLGSIAQPGPTIYTTGRVFLCWKFGIMPARPDAANPILVEILSKQNKNIRLSLHPFYLLRVSLNILQRLGEASVLFNQMKDSRVENLLSGVFIPPPRSFRCTTGVTVWTPGTHRHIMNVEIQ